MATTSGVPTFVYNHDVSGLHRRINRFIVELLRSVSSGVSQVNSFDQERLQSYLDAITAYHGWVVDQPQLDLPETHPRQINLNANPTVDTIENESLQDVVTLLTIARDELVSSQSSRQGSGLVPFDSARLTAIVDKVQHFLVDYIGTTTPLDLPESSPDASITPPGSTGV